MLCLLGMVVGIVSVRFPSKSLHQKLRNISYKPGFGHPLIIDRESLQSAEV